MEQPVILAVDDEPAASVRTLQSSRLLVISEPTYLSLLSSSRSALRAILRVVYRRARGDRDSDWA